MTSRARVMLAAGALAVFAALSGCAPSAVSTSGSAGSQSMAGNRWVSLSALEAAAAKA